MSLSSSAAPCEIIPGTLQALYFPPDSITATNKKRELAAKTITSGGYTLYVFSDGIEALD